MSYPHVVFLSFVKTETRYGKIREEICWKVGKLVSMRIECRVIGIFTRRFQTSLEAIIKRVFASKKSIHWPFYSLQSVGKVSAIIK
jgi:hypothetical protein